MTKESETSPRLASRQAVAAMVDGAWSPLTLGNVTIQPQWLMWDEAVFLGWCTYIVPLSWMPTLVRQWTGPEGEQMYTRLVGKA